jgi:hypothetical protein
MLIVKLNRFLRYNNSKLWQKVKLIIWTIRLKNKAIIRKEKTNKFHRDKVKINNIPKTNNKGVKLNKHNQ